MSKLRPQYLISTDSIGLFGKPEQFIYLWKEYFENKTLDGVEVIAFKPLSKLKKLLSELKSSKIPVISLHGKTGSGEITMKIINRLIFDAKILSINFPELEFLSHAPYFEKKEIFILIQKIHPKKIWIENHRSGKQGVEDAIKQIIFYRENGVNTNGMLDVYHFVAGYKNLSPSNWDNLVEELRAYVLKKDKNGKQIFNGIHFPVGTRPDDSLPIDSMSDEMLELFARKIIPLIERVVFENQQKNFGLLFSTNKMLEKQKSRNKKIIERLKKTGIIC